MQKLIRELAQAFQEVESGTALVVTGAGISRASGIPTFRGSEPGAVWKMSDMTLATLDYFRRDPVGQWQWYLQRFESVEGAAPNAGHRAVADLDSWIQRHGGHFRLVTQNIDCLHERAGSRDVLKVHGTADRVRCSRPGCANGSPRGSVDLSEIDFSKFLAEPRRDTLPTCSECGSLLRAHVLFFDEYYLEHLDYRFAEAEALAEEASLLLFVGTSFSVGITDLYLRAGLRRGLPMFSVDPAGTEARWPGLRPVAAPAEEILPAVHATLVA